MSERLHEILHLDLDKIAVRKGIVGMLAILATIVFVAVFGIIGMTAAFAALFVFAADVPGPVRGRLTGVLVLTIGGALVALVGVWAGTEHIWLAALLTFIVTVAGTLSAAFGGAAATRGLLLALWAILALSFSSNPEPAGEFAAAFALGGILAAIILFVQARLLTEPAEGANGDAAERSDESGPPSVGSVLRSPLGWFSLIRGGSVALATVLGIELFPEHAIWPALTVLLVLRPKAGETVENGVLRTLGTLIGVLLAGAVIWLADGSDTALVIAFLVAAFAMTALKEVNYAVFVLFLTALLIFVQALIGADADQAAAARFLATLLGAGIAFAALALGRAILGRPSSSASPSD